VHVGDVWYLAAQYEQRRMRRRHTQQQQQQGKKPHQLGGDANGLSPADGHQPPAAKRAKLDKQQQQHAPTGISWSASDDMPTPAGEVTSEGGTPRGPSRHAPADDKQQRSRLGGAGQAAGSSRQPGRHPNSTSAAAGGGASELMLRPFKVGPTPDKLQQLWDDVQKVSGGGGQGGQGQVLQGQCKACGFYRML